MMRKLFNGLAVLLVLVLVVGLYRAKSEADSARRRVAELEAEIALLETESRILAAEEALLDSPDRIERLARRYLRMAPPTPEPEGAVLQAAPQP